MLLSPVETELKVDQEYSHNAFIAESELQFIPRPIPLGDNLYGFSLH